MMIEDSRKLIFMGLFIITVFYWRHTRSSVIVPMSLQHDPRTIRIKLHKKDTIASFLKYLHFNPAFISPIGYVTALQRARGIYDAYQFMVERVSRDCIDLPFVCFLFFAEI